jgi:Mg2+ and Co2+ transporter CorA
MAEGVADRTRADVALRCVRVVTWLDDEVLVLDEQELRTTPQRANARAGGPIWVQLVLPWLDDDQQKWFEGSVDPWSDVVQPGVDWTGVAPVLAAVGLTAEALDGDEWELLQRLPYLYGRGVTRVEREVWGRESPKANRTNGSWFLPAVSFRPEMCSGAPRFWVVRMAIGIIGNVVVTVRLPDLWWDDDHFDYSPADALDVPTRFYPLTADITVEDVAEAIALHQASTAREVSQRVRTRLTEIERTWRFTTASRAARQDAMTDAADVTEMTDSLYQLERQLERLLRRFGHDGLAPTAAAVPSDIALRYRFALDELRSLEGNAQLASLAVGRALTTGEQEDRERFHLVAAALASAILIPTLVASIYGADVSLPGQNSWRGFVALLLFILAFAMVGLFGLFQALERGWIGLMPSTARLRGKHLSLIPAIVAVLAVAGGVIEVVRD